MSPVTPDIGPRVGRAASTAATSLGRLAGVVRGVAFWLAVALPPVHLVVLFAGEFTAADLTLLVLLFVCNAAALVAGHGHGVDR